MTPRQLAAFRFLAERRRERDMAHLLSVIALGSQGKAETIQEQIGKWEQDM